MLIEKIIEFELRGPGSSSRIRVSKTSYFHDMAKQKSLKNVVECINVLITAEILQEAICLTSPYWAKSCTKFNSQKQDFKHVLDLNCK